MKWGVAICHRNTFTNLKDKKIGKARVSVRAKVRVRVIITCEDEGGARLKVTV